MKLEMKYYVMKLSKETNGYLLAKRLLKGLVNEKYQMIPNSILAEILLDFEEKVRK